jgi:hypothetical protein
MMAMYRGTHVTFFAPEKVKEPPVGIFWKNANKTRFLVK